MIWKYLNKFPLYLVVAVQLYPLNSKSQLPDFISESVVSDLLGPVSGAILPDNRMLIIFQNGLMLITSDLDQPPVTTSIYMNLPDVNGTAEHGLMEIILDPNFDNNDQFYLYYTPNSLQVNRLSRFTHSVDTCYTSSEVIVWETPDIWSGCCHVGGAITFLPDSTILIGVGDDFQPLLAQDLSSSHGKLHRISMDGSIPPDNPFYDGTPGPLNANGELQSIFAYGLRNPFRGAYDILNDRFFIGEVGGNDHSVAWEDVHEAEAGVNFGWPFCGQVGREPDGSCSDSIYSDPIFTYPHAGSGASITAGLFYSGEQFPLEWQGRFFYADWVRGWIRYLEFDSSGAVISDEAFIDQNLLGGAEALTVVKILHGLNGELYIISMFEDFVDFTGGINRIKYNGPLPPQCINATATPSTGSGPSLSVVLSAVANDPNGDTLQYIWNPGDGSPLDTGQTISHNYNGIGIYYAQVSVSDGDSTVHCTPVEIVIGIEVELEIRAFLEGPMDQSNMLMRDDLRMKGLIPIEEPYSALGYTHYGGGGGEQLDTNILTIAGNDAIVDWILVELRDMNDTQLISYTRSALIQRDGDIVDVDGTSALGFPMQPGTYHIALRHRNHLGCMTLNPFFLDTNATVQIDLTDASNPTFGIDAQSYDAGIFALWAGNCKLDTIIKYAGPQNDRDAILDRISGIVQTAVVTGYFSEDSNLDGQVKYVGWDNDRDAILKNIGGQSVVVTRQEQLP